MALDIDTLRLYDRLNRRLAKFDKAGVTNNTVDLVRHELRLFYESISADLSVKRIDKFTTSKQLTPQQQAELTAIANAMDNIKSSNLSYYTQHKDVDERFKKAYETTKKKYKDVTDLQSYIDFVDRAKGSAVVGILKQFMDSGQAMRISMYATRKKMTDKQLITLIQKNYKKFTDGDQLYLFLTNEIDKKYKQKTTKKSGANRAKGKRIK